jgi:cytochrome c5
MTARRRHTTLALPLAISLTGPLAAEDAAKDASSAHALYEQNCIKCHGSEIYTRPDRKVDSLDALGRQVQRCETALGLRWFDEDIHEVTTLLNDRFYRFQP